MKNVRAIVLTLSATFASFWGGVLLDAHRKAMLELALPGGLCEGDGGCADVLSSEWSTIGGVAVSTPAIPLFAAVAVLAALVAVGRANARRIAGLATGASVVGLGFGGWLLYQMLIEIEHVCRYCLVMDGATLAVFLSALFLHDDGPLGALRELPNTLRRLASIGPELGTFGAVVLGTPLITVVFPDPTEASVALEAPLPGAPSTSGETRKLVIPPGRVEVALSSTTPILGPSDAPVTVVLFEDFQCPFCRRLTGSLDAFRREDPQRVRIAWFHFPMHSACNVREGMTDMHDKACDAAVAAECARRQGKFWEYHDRLFADQRLAPPDLLAHAQQVGLDLTAFAACQSDPSAMQKVLDDTAEGRKFNITGTPTWFINGKRFSGAQPPDALRAIAAAVLSSDAKQEIEVAVDGEVTGPPPVGGPDMVELVGPRGPFTIDTFEASIVDGAARSVPNVAPARGVPWSEADAACKKAGKRLCAEDEWLTACIGAVPVDADGDLLFSDDPQAGRQHPYGPYPQPTWCASARKRAEDVLVTGNHPRCFTPEGVADLEGNVKEWVGLSPSLAALQGGSYYSGDNARCAFHRSNESPEVRDPANGFRCCKGPAPEVVAVGPDGGRVGEGIRSWSVAGLDGGTIDSAGLAGKPYILVFWASWCGPCRKELPVLVDLYERYRGQGLEIVAVTIDTAAGPAKRFLSEMPLPFLLAIDPRSELMSGLGATSPPTSFFVTRSGKIRQRNVGYDEKGGAAAIEADIRELLAAP